MRSAVQHAQRVEGVLLTGRPQAAALVSATPAPASTVSLPVKNNAILIELLGVLENFNKRVEHEVAAGAKAQEPRQAAN